MSQDHFGDDVAETYDSDVSDEFDPAVIASIVSFLADGATDGSALEFGIGTGRIALPLHHLGLDVEGIDLSSSMVERMRRKPGGAELRVAIGDFTSTSMDRTFDLAYLVFNTIMNLTTQEEQVACFANAEMCIRDR